MIAQTLSVRVVRKQELVLTCFAIAGVKTLVVDFFGVRTLVVAFVVVRTLVVSIARVRTFVVAIAGVRKFDVAIAGVRRFIVAIAGVRTLVSIWIGWIKAGKSAKMNLLAYIKSIETEKSRKLALEQKNFVAKIDLTMVRQ